MIKLYLLKNITYSPRYVNAASTTNTTPLRMDNQALVKPVLTYDDFNAKPL